MKHTFTFLMIILILLLVFSFTVSVSADEFTDYRSDWVSAEESSEFLERISFKISADDKQKRSFRYFAVSEQGKVALSFHTASGVNIKVYNAEGQYLYGYQFDGGAGYAVFFEEEDLSIIWGKEGYIGSFDEHGECIRFRKDDNSQHNADVFHDDRYPPRNAHVGAITYHAKGALFSSRYWRISIEDANGSETVIYDVTREHTICEIIRAVVILCGTLVIISIVRKKKETNT